MENNRTITISLETAKEWYKGNNETLKSIALQAYTENELQTITCVKSWEEFCEKYNNRNKDYFIDPSSYIVTSGIYTRDVNKDRNLLATKKDAESFLTLMQLKRLRDQWWEVLNWIPDYTNNKTIKYTIVMINDEIGTNFTYTYSRFLAFPSKEIAKEFLKCFRDLIEKAKELL